MCSLRCIGAHGASVHIGLKCRSERAQVLALVAFMLSGILFGGNYVVTFVCVTVLSALDFWTVKNVSGRLLVGLRWWNTIDDSGESKWYFESYEDQRFIHPTDSNGFWLGLFVAPVVWAFLACSTLFTLRFMWLVLVIVAFTCNAINVVGYVKCKRDAGVRSWFEPRLRQRASLTHAAPLALCRKSSLRSAVQCSLAASTWPHGWRTCLAGQRQLQTLKRNS